MSLGLLSEGFISTPKPLIPQNLMSLILSNLYMKPVWVNFEFFTSDNHHMELSLLRFPETYSIVHICFQGTKVGHFFSEISKMADFADLQILQTIL